MPPPAEPSPDRLTSSQAIVNPYPVYRSLRDRTPFRYLHFAAGAVQGVAEPVHAWALMHYAHVYGALRNHAVFSSAMGPDQAAGKYPRHILLNDDPPRHTTLRRLVNQAFGPKRIESLEPWISGIARNLLDGLGTGEIDFVSAFGSPFPIQVIAGLLGVPGNEYARFKQWSDAAISRKMPPLERKAHTLEMMAFFGRLSLERRKEAAEDIISDLVGAELEGESLSDWEVLGFCMLLLIVGNETTTNLLGNLLHVLADRPELWRRLRDDRALVDAVIEESLRFDSPIRMVTRVTTQPAQIAGVEIPKGELVSLFCAAANRDPAEFPDPDDFQPDRAMKNHLAFGQGIHHCLAAPLARVEAKIALNELLDRFASVSRGQAPAVRQDESAVVYGLKSLPLLLQ